MWPAVVSLLRPRKSVPLTKSLLHTRRCVFVHSLVVDARALLEQVDKHAKQVTTNPKLIENIVNVARLVPTGDAGYKTDTF